GARSAGSEGGRFVAGWGAPADGRQHAFRWSRRDGMVDLTPFTWESTGATAVGNDGTVAGNSYEPWSGVNRGVVWTEWSGAIDLGTLGGSITRVRAISPGREFVFVDSSLPGR